MAEDATMPEGRHKGHCFVVMPFGQDAEEERWFKGWYEAVIYPAIESVGLEPILAATQDEPSAINDEIRSHLVFDDVVVVDLGGRRVSDPPNPNVMYELGIRHAFGLPVVLIAWEGQRLPFDVTNQRAILSRRDFLDLEPTRNKLARFIEAAREGRFYNPMDAVAREAQIETTSMVLGEESLLTALAAEIRDLRQSVLHARPPAGSRWVRAKTIKSLLGKRRSELWEWAQSNGFDPTSWGKLLRQTVSEQDLTVASSWSVEEWIAYVQKLPIEELHTIKVTSLTAEFVEQVKLLLPAQPWPKGTHHEIAAKLDASDRQVTRAIQQLIKEGVFKQQHDGLVIE